MDFNGAFPNDDGTESIWVGNGGYGTANLTVNGGSVSVLNGTVLGRDTSTGNLSISSGSFSTGVFSTSVGAYVGAPFGSGSGVGTITIGNGGSFVVRSASTDPLIFGGNLKASSTNSSTSYVNFTTGSTGSLVLNLSSATLGANYFNSLITNGYVKINGAVDTTVAHYTINTSTLSAATLGVAVVAPAQMYYFQGATSTDPSVVSNYYSGAGNPYAPAYSNGSVTDYTMYVSQAPFGGNNLVFGPTLNTSNLGYLYAGYYVNGNVTVTGGTVNFGHSGGTGAQNVFGLTGGANGTMAVSGGVISFLGGDTGDGTSLWIGNQANGTIYLTGGTINTQAGVDLSRDSGNGTLNISGGLFSVQGATGTIAKNASSGGTATLNFLTGNGVFRQTSSAAFSSSIAIRFSYQTAGQLQLTTSTNPFAALAAAGSLYYQTASSGSYVQLDNTSTDSNYYLKYLTVTTSGGLQVLSVAPPTNRTLDNLASQASGAFSLRLLSKNYAGSAIQVRRSSDNTTMNIGFNSLGGLSTSTLLSFAGSSSCYVTTWYDQSGSGNNVTNATAADQPMIVNAGSLVTMNGQPAVLFAQSPSPTALSSTANLITASQSTISVVSQLASGAGSGFNLFIGNSAANYFGWIGSYLVLTANNGQELAPSTQTTSPSVITSLRSTTAGLCYLNGYELTNSSSTLDSTAAAINSVGGFSPYGLVGSMPELICFNTQLSLADQTTLQNDQGNFYGIPVINSAPVAPAQVATSAGNGAVLLQWSNGTNSTSYLVEYKASTSSTWTSYGQVTTNGLTLTGLTNGTLYNFRVSSINPRATSAPSNVVSATPLATATFATTWNQTLSNGQSLSTGYNGGPPLTLTQPYSNQMLTSDNSTLIPLVEPATGASGSVESMSSALANELTHLATGTVPNFISIVSMHGVPGAPYSSLEKGTAAYANGIAEMNSAFNLARAAGVPFSVDAVSIVHGETDEQNGVSAATYEGYLEQWQSNYQSDVEAVTGQTGTITLFTDQMSSWTILNHATPTTAIGQWEAGRDNPGVIDLVTPLYIMDYASDGIHLTNYSYRRMGEYFGKVMKQVLVDKKPWTPVSPSSVTRSGKVITAVFNVPVGPLVIDTTAVNMQANYGFEYYDSSNSATISSVAITAANTIQITLSNTPTVSTGELRYAFTGTSGSAAGAHITGSAKGNIRDSDATQALYQDSNVPAAMGIYLRNWLVTFDMPITVTN